jgi:hypothetical protein
MSTEMTQNNQINTVSIMTEEFNLLQRKATLLANSSLVPSSFRLQIEKKEFGKVVGYETNSNAIANCAIAIDMAHRMKANELMVMQNLYIVSGRPSWSSQWIIAAINNCGKYTSLRFDMEDLGEKEVEYFEEVWANGKKSLVLKKIKIHNWSCVAYATEKETNQRLESSKITIEMAVKEGWYTKAGSKWQTMPEIMLRYRASSFFGKIYSPELLMGLQTVEENQDIGDLSPKYPNAVEMPSENKPAKFVPTPIVEKVKQESTPEPTLDISNAVQDAQDYKLEDIMAEVSGDKKESW